ncbi:hypothetical protein HZP39_12120 [Elizabethkingia anophelis]|uniref:DUF6273 domain-containing protein n=1 Tax=Elizabethkingia TaxID=308865 RepID=UPI001365A5E7|nr:MULTISPECIES: DUF6273 domain-containing protein [Elizabethkingia]MCT3669337.1 hypothetical protein [Elizabethkingia anophelis]MCT3688890.1 hypothetical protein [Elizabethkingia anophelis]MCT3705736.1 hypothetical protein [Elizabethkingia anophelis]MCT3712754.1 hypothetical protein [Elizabethkingia anophelis]MCT3716172.1 hypothetical protein [Elizabethkingia anophelis]
MKKDDIIVFGNYNWLVLDVKVGNALIITENIIEQRWYHSCFVDITWADCELRNYLNNEFYNTFGSDEKDRIIAVTNTNDDNQWFKTNGGTDTCDYIFLLSLEEVCKYFGDSCKGLFNKDNQKWLIDDENNRKRQVKFGAKNHWWRLRSPGYYGRTSASVSINGNIYVRGNGVYGTPKDSGGVRPALWLKIG